MEPEIVDMWESGRILLFRCVQIPEVIGTADEIIGCAVRVEQTEFLPYEPDDKRIAEAYLKDWVFGGLTKVQKKVQVCLKRVKQGLDERQRRRGGTA